MTQRTTTERENKGKSAHREREGQEVCLRKENNRKRKREKREGGVKLHVGWSVVWTMSLREPEVQRIREEDDLWMEQCVEHQRLNGPVMCLHLSVRT